MMDKEIETIISECAVVRIAMCYKHVPYLYSFQFGYDEENIYFKIKNNGYLSNIFRKGDKLVSFSLDHLNDRLNNAKYEGRYCYINGWGWVKVLDKTSEQYSAYTAIEKRYQIPGMNEDLDRYFEIAMKESLLCKLAITTFDLLDKCIHDTYDFEYIKEYGYTKYSGAG